MKSKKHLQSETTIHSSLTARWHRIHPHPAPENAVISLAAKSPPAVLQHGMAQPQAPHHRQRFLPQGKWGRVTTQNLHDHVSYAPASILHTLSDHEESMNPKKEIWLPPRCALWDHFLAVRSRGWPSGGGTQGASLMCWMQHPSFWQCLNSISCKLVLKELWIKRTDLMGLSPSQDLFKLITVIEHGK